MGTRSRVGIMQGDVCKSVYCHYDGYLEHAGQMLLKHWDEAEVLELIKMGDNSGIQESVGDMNFYRDRGETGVGAQKANTFDEFLEQVENCGGEYYYVMRDGVWYAGAVYDVVGLKKGGLVQLADALAANTIDHLIAEDE
jgi:hypothetical protein